MKVSNRDNQDKFKLEYTKLIFPIIIHFKYLQDGKQIHVRNLKYLIDRHCLFHLIFIWLTKNIWDNWQICKEIDVSEVAIYKNVINFRLLWILITKLLQTKLTFFLVAMAIYQYFNHMGDFVTRNKLLTRKY